MQISKHILTGKGVELIRSKKSSAPLKDPDTIVLHYTAGSTPESTVQYLISRKTKESAHLLITRKGGIIQMTDFLSQAWHAGLSSHNGRTNVNEFSIGIELENAGQLNEDRGTYYSWFFKRIPESEVFKHTDRNTSKVTYWQSYTEAQLEALHDVIDLLTEAYDIKYVAGHSEVSPGRKVDPGPAFPIEEFRIKAQ